MCSVASSRSCLLCGLQCLVLVPAVPCCLEGSQTCALICLGLEFAHLVLAWKGGGLSQRLLSLPQGTHVTGGKEHLHSSCAHPDS